MGSYKIKRLNLPKLAVDIFERQNLSSCKDVLNVTEVELQTLLGVSKREIEQIVRDISKKCLLDTPKTVSDLLIEESFPFFQTSLENLDHLLQGGLPIGSITEIAGPPGVGKTQFCFLMTILGATPACFGGLNGNVIYIDTELVFSAERVKKIAQSRMPVLYSKDDELSAMLRRVEIYKAASISEMEEMLPNLESEIIKNNVKLLIVDSMASLVRKEYGSEYIQSLTARNRKLMEYAAHLKDLAQTYKLVVLLTNQITSMYSESELALNEKSVSYAAGTAGEHNNFAPKFDESTVIPALGNTWSHCVNTRLIAHFQSSSVRQLTIAKSPVAPNASVWFIIDDCGPQLIDDDIDANQDWSMNQKMHSKYKFLSEITAFSITGMLK